jgi:hypothetical protein
MRRPNLSSRGIMAVSGAALLIVALLGVYLLGPKSIASRLQTVAFNGVIETKTIIGPRRSRSFSSRYILVIRQETGRVVRFPVPWEIYEQARVGMPVRKKAGEPWPTLGASASP